MSAGRIPSPQKSTYRGYKDQFDGTIPPVKVTPTNRDAAIVLARISLRREDCTDVLEALGLIPTIYPPAAVKPPTFCDKCDWHSVTSGNPQLALMTHTRSKHKAVLA